MKRFVTIVVLLVLIAAGVYAYRMYTGKVKSLEDADADATVTAIDLVAAFEKDSATANKQYLGKIVAVTGNIKSIEKESGSIVLGEEASMSSVRCSLDTNFVKKIAGLNLGNQITIKGACTGFNADELGLGSDVVLNRCVIPANKN
ncbi:MAG: hypothetical protein JWQ40_5022 [Segetibacter sp.]|nr:hypothetical protein [Segetibacter sp.]